MLQQLDVQGDVRTWRLGLHTSFPNLPMKAGDSTEVQNLKTFKKPRDVFKRFKISKDCINASGRWPVE